MRSPETEPNHHNKEKPINVVVASLNHLIGQVQQVGTDTRQLVGDINDMLEPIRAQEVFLMRWNYDYYGMEHTELGKLVARIYQVVSYHKDYPQAGPCLLLS